MLPRPIKRLLELLLTPLAIITRWSVRDHLRNLQNQLDLERSANQQRFDELGTQLQECTQSLTKIRVDLQSLSQRPTEPGSDLHDLTRRISELEQQLQQLSQG